MKKLLLVALLATTAINAQATACINTERFVTETMKARVKGVDKHKMMEHAVLMRDSEQGLELMRAINIVFNSLIDSDPKTLGHDAWVKCINETYGD